jgi:hypothetical protein
MMETWSATSYQFSFKGNLDFLAWSDQTKQKEVMVMLITNTSEAKTQLSALIEA